MLNDFMFDFKMKTDKFSGGGGGLYQYVILKLTKCTEMQYISVIL